MSPLSSPPHAPLTREHLERYLPLLRILAQRLRIDPRFQARFDHSDIVSEALRRALEGLSGFQGDEPALLPWLVRILNTTFLDELDHHDAQRRTPDAEIRAIQNAMDESSQRLEGYLSNGSLGPQERAMRREELLRLTCAVDRLPKAQREVIVLFHLEELSVNQIAERLGRSAKSIAGLLRRARSELSKQLVIESGH